MAVLPKVGDWLTDDDRGCAEVIEVKDDTFFLEDVYGNPVVLKVGQLADWRRIDPSKWRDPNPSKFLDAA